MGKLCIDDFRSDNIGLDYERALEYDARTFFNRSESVEAPCPLCGRFSEKTVHNLHGFSILECMCGFVYLSPRPSETELAEFYKHGKSNALWHEILNETREKRKENYSHNIAPILYKHLGEHYDGKLIDIGCGEGMWLDVLKGMLPQAELFGVEPFASEDLKSKHNIIECFFEEMDSKNEFDVCSLMSVVEHISDPVKFLYKTKDILNDGGLVFITAPNMSGFDSLVLCPEDRNWEVPQHINFFDIVTLRRCVESVGFTIVDMGTFGFLDVDIISRSGKDLGNSFLNKLLYDSNYNDARVQFQKFLTSSGLSGQMYIIARK